MKIPVIYATIEGQTGKIAKFIDDKLRSVGHEPVLINANDPTEISFADAQRVVLAAPVHERRHPQNFEALLAAHAADLDRKKVLLISVSLSAAFPQGIQDANDYVVEMKMRTGLQPERELLVAGAVRLDQYDYFAMQVLQHVVLRERDYDPNDGEHEFTDWDALEKDLSEFLNEGAEAA